MTARARSTVWLLGAGAAVSLMLALALPSAAEANGRESVTVSLGGAPFTERPTGELLRVDGLAPGGSAQAILGVRSGMHEASELTLRLVTVRDADDGCTAPERGVDPSCGSGPGDLGRELRFAVAVASSPHGSYTTAWSGTAREWQRGVDLGVGLDAGSTTWLRVRAAVPAAAGNEIESDSFRFGLRVVLQATEGTAGVTVGRGTGPNPTTQGSGVDALAELGFTGVPVALLVLAAALATAAGLVVLVAARRRPDGPASS